MGQSVRCPRVGEEMPFLLVGRNVVEIGDWKALLGDELDGRHTWQRQSRWLFLAAALCALNRFPDNSWLQSTLAKNDLYLRDHQAGDGCPFGIAFGGSPSDAVKGSTPAALGTALQATILCFGMRRGDAPACEGCSFERLTNLLVKVAL